LNERNQNHQANKIKITPSELLRVTLALKKKIHYPKLNRTTQLIFLILITNKYFTCGILPKIHQKGKGPKF